MTANEIRTKFLDFFALKGHTIVPSASLVPAESEDTTVLFTTAGMQQFKRQFLGHLEGYTRAASCQKCLRTDDLDKIGKTPYHHTFFEMLGNFSFGDYFKKDAIKWAWEFLTKEMELPAEKLWVSVYEDDDEAYNVWLKNIKVPAKKIVKLGDKSNFWPAEAKEKGPNGPCGPCSEIFYDYGKNKENPCSNEECNPDCSCGRFSEVWNLVFTQFNRKDGGVLEPLPAKNIDTGMGLERLAAVVQGKYSNYGTDNFTVILGDIKEAIKTNGANLYESEYCIVADHIRAITFGIADGAVPSNEGRGYVIRKLIVDITDLCVLAGVQKPIVYTFVDAVVKIMGKSYPEITTKADEIKCLVKRIEKGFIKLRHKRVSELKERIAKTKDNAQVLSELFFLYRDTHGLTIYTISKVATETGVSPLILAEARVIFGSKMDKQKNRSRAASKMTGDVFANAELNLNVPKTEFLGYDEKNYSSEGKILKLFVNNQEVQTIQHGDKVKIVLDRTPFYAESGGQVGDTGLLTKKGGRIKITDTQKIADVFIHTGSVEEGIFNVNDQVLAQIDVERRLAIMRNHTATHLLQAALRRVLGTHVQQQGSLVAPDRLRFDFTHHQAVSKEQLREIESIINNQIKAGHQVDKKIMDLKAAKESGATAFFAEKYKDVVRVVSIGDYSKELCGGTHLKSTDQIGQLKIAGEGAVAQGIRRIEARTETGAREFIREREKQEAGRIESETKRLQELEKKREGDRKTFETFKSSLEKIIKDADTIHNTKVITYTFTNSDANQLKKFSDLIKQQVPSVAICMGSTFNDSASVIVGVSGDLVEKGIRANELIKDIAPLINGNGGGRPELAQAGSKDPSNLSSAIAQAKKILLTSLKNLK